MNNWNQHVHNNQGNQIDGDVKPIVIKLGIFTSKLANMFFKFIF
jgi:hypothetical protein